MNMPWILILAGLLASSGARAATLYVDTASPQAADTNSGTAGTPLKTVQAAANRVQPGDTVYLRAGLYREQFTIRTSGTAQAPITFAAAPGDQGKVLFRGTEGVTNATAVATPQGMAYTLPYVRTFWLLGDETNRVFRDYVDQVFVDDALLQAVPEQAMLRPGRYWVDRTAKPGRLHFMLPPGKALASSTVEVSRLQWAIRFDPANPANPREFRPYEYVNIRGFSFFGFATNPRCPVIQFRRCRHMRLEDCTVRWCNAEGLSLDDSSYITLARNDVQHCGHLGIGGGRLDHITVEDNITSFNNYKLYSVWWECGGIKLCGITDSVIRRHVAIGNEGEGMWFDWDCSRNVVEDSLSAYNVVSGFLNEVAPGNTYRRNIFAFNRVIQGAGISISGSSDTLVENNIFHGNEGAAVDIGGAPGKRAYSNDFVKCNRNRIERNLMVSNAFNVAIISPIPEYAMGNVIDRNLYWAWKAEQPVLLDGKPTRFDDWRKASSNDLRSVMADPLFTDPARLDFSLKRGSPARQVGFKAAGMRLDWSAFATALPAPEAGTAVRHSVGRSFFVDLGPCFNRALRDEVSGDGRGGWTDQGPNDLRNLPAGERRFEGVPFSIGTGTLAAVALASPRVKIPGAPLHVSIPVGRKARALYFLHTVAWADQGTLFRYEIQAGDRTFTLPMRSGRELMDWWAPVLWQEAETLERHGAFAAWQGANGAVGQVTVFATRWENPTPDLPITTIEFAAEGGNAAPCLLAVTGVEEEEDRAAAGRAAAQAAGLPRPGRLTFYLPFDGEASAHTPQGPAEAFEARGAAWDSGRFIAGVRGQALHFTTFSPVTFDDAPRYLHPAAGSFSAWIRPDDWFTPAKLQTYKGAEYQRTKSLLSADLARGQARVAADPGRGNFSITLQANGTATERKAALVVCWSGVYFPAIDITAWQPLTWHHVAVTWESTPPGGRIRLYVDGTLARETPFTGTLRPPPPVLFFGNARNGGYPVNSALDEVAIWDQALTAEDVRSYHAGALTK
jgi:hypothetical protein